VRLCDIYSPAAFMALVFASWPSLAADAPNTSPVPAPSSLVEPWPRAIAVGGGISTQGRASGELTFSAGIGGPQFSVGYVDSSDGRRAYVEGGANLILNLAAGIGYHGESSPASRWGFHAFAGLPLPMLGWGRDGLSTPFTFRVHIAPLLLYAEPFYRPEFRRGAPIDHEVGVLLKLRIGITKRQWSLPGYDMMADVVI
jgi:hypothetical protein